MSPLDQEGTMTELGDDQGRGTTPDLPRPATGPEQWLGAPDPLQSFGNTIEQALQRLTIELAGLRAERDGLRLELEGLRTQLQLTQQQLGDRERFAATVRELGQIVQQLSAPPRWGGDPVAAAAGQAAAAAPYGPPPAQYVAPAPAPVAYAPPPPPPAAPPIEAAAYAPPAPEAFAPPAPPPAPAAPPPPTPEPVAAPPVADVSPFAAPPAAPAPAPEPEPEPEPIRPEPAPTSAFSFGDAPPSRTPVVAATEESFFSGPGVWIGEPPKADGRRTLAKTWLTRAGSAIAIVIVAVVFLVSIGPKFLPYQTFFVRSGSMSPTFDTGDMIVLSKVDASDLKARDIITFDRPDKPGTLVTHRIVSVETNASGKQFVTKGDANSSPDPWRVPASGTGWRYRSRIPKLGYVFGYLGTPQARLALLAIPALLLGILSIIDIWKPQPKARGRR
jgi:signal peptidase